MLRCIVTSDVEVMGSVDLVGDTAEATSDVVEQMMKDITIVLPGDPDRVLKPEDGPLYVSAFAQQVSGSYVHTNLVFI